MSDWIKRYSFSRNVKWALTQTVISGLTLFVLYRQLLEILGPEAIGIWSLIVALTSISRIGDLGLPGGVTRFVAQALAANDHDRASGIIQTSFLALTAAALALLTCGYLLLPELLVYVLPSESMAQGVAVLPIVLASFLVTTISAIFHAGLDGCQKSYRRSMLISGGQIFYLALSLFLIRESGLKGLADAQFIHSIIILVLSWIILRSTLKSLPILPFQWKFSLFKELFRYGATLQMIGFLLLLFDPITKSLVGRYGGLSTLGYYEMGSRLISQLRQLLVEANKAVIPVISSMGETSDSILICKKNIRLISILAIPYFAFIALSAPVIAEIWLGRIEPFFVFTAIVLSFAWLINTIWTPAYFYNLGVGRIRINLIAHLIIAVLIIVGGIFGGETFGGHGVVIAYAIALLGSSIFVAWSFIKLTQFETSGISLLFKYSGAVLIISIGFHSLLSEMMAGYSITMQLLVLAVAGAFLIGVICSRPEIRMAFNSLRMNRI